MTGADGFLVADPLQYLDWSRQAGRARADRQPARPRAGRPRVPAPGAAALRAARGGSAPGPAVAYLLWKPVAVGVLFAGHAGARAALPGAAATTAASRSCSRCSPARRWRRSSAGAGWGTPAAKLQVDFVTGELWSGSYLWGYLFTAIAVGLLPLGLLAYERARGRRRARAGGGRRGAGLLCAWLQPWQGATFAFVIAAAELVELARGAARRGRPRTAAAPRAISRCRSRRPPRRSSTTRCSAATTRRGRSPRRSTTCRAGRGGRCSAGSRRSRCPPRSRTGCRRRTSAPSRCGRGRSPALARLLPAVRDVPVPRAPGAHAAARRARRARAAGLARRAAGAARCRRRPRSLVLVRRRDRVPRREPRRRRPRRPPAVHARRRASAPRCATSTRVAGAGRRARAGLHRASPCRPTRAARPGSAPARGRRTSRSAPRRPRRCSPAGSTPAAAEALVRRSGARFVLSDCHGRADICAAARGLHRPAAAVRLRDGLEACAGARGAFPLVDALRAIAALLIVAYHVAFVSGGLGPRRRRAVARAASTSACRCSSRSPASCSTGPWVAARLAGDAAAVDRASTRCAARCGSCPPTGWRSS